MSVKTTLSEEAREKHVHHATIMAGKKVRCQEHVVGTCRVQTSSSNYEQREAPLPRGLPGPQRKNWPDADRHNRRAHGAVIQGVAANSIRVRSSTSSSGDSR